MIQRSLVVSLIVCTHFIISVGLGGCATAQNPDPLEPMNRKVFAFNEVVDKNVLKPVAEGYKNHVPQPLRTMTASFFNNFLDAWSAINLFLQGRFGDGATETMRVATNTVFGVFGLADVATPMGLRRHGEDFGQTLGVWGFGSGPYLVLPLLGPSSGRDIFDLPGEVAFAPSSLTTDATAQVVISSVRLVDARANLLQATNFLENAALDKYSFTRDSYLQRRRNLVYNGNPPDDEAHSNDVDKDIDSDIDSGAEPDAGAD
jgi:phospholipid-binding lipoprotein MlaA